MLIIDGRTGKTRSVHAGLPQESPVSPVLFIFSVSSMFQWLEERYPMLQAILFVEVIRLVVESGELEQGTRQLDCVAGDAIRWGSDNKVDSEVGKTEALVYTRRR